MKRCKSLINTLKGIGSSIDPRSIPTIVSNDSLKDEPTFTLSFLRGKVVFYHFLILEFKESVRKEENMQSL